MSAAKSIAKCGTVAAKIVAVVRTVVTIVCIIIYGRIVVCIPKPTAIAATVYAFAYSLTCAVTLIVFRSTRATSVRKHQKSCQGHKSYCLYLHYGAPPQISPRNKASCYLKKSRFLLNSSHLHAT
jgi:hypothetical protein